MYDLSTQEEAQITKNESYQGDSSIYGDRIVWRDTRNGNDEIFMYDLSTSREIQITNGGYSGGPKIYGDRIVWGTNTNNIYMCDLSGREPGPVIPVANFSTNATSGYAPLTVQFTDLSKNATEWNWDFGDGVNSTEQNPMHTYSAAGNYTVRLTVSSVSGQSTKIGEINVKTIRQGPIADFSASPASGKTPLKVSFTDKSTGSPTEWEWSFGDGKVSTQQNPKHTYSKEGNYTVSLTVKNDVGSSEETKSECIIVSRKK